MRMLERVYRTANLVGLRKNIDAWPDSQAHQMPSMASCHSRQACRRYRGSYHEAKQQGQCQARPEPIYPLHAAKHAQV